MSLSLSNCAGIGLGEVVTLPGRSAAFCACRPGWSGKADLVYAQGMNCVTHVKSIQIGYGVLATVGALLILAVLWQLSWSLKVHSPCLKNGSGHWVVWTCSKRPAPILLFIFLQNVGMVILGLCRAVDVGGVLGHGVLFTFIHLATHYFFWFTLAVWLRTVIANGQPSRKIFRRKIAITAIVCGGLIGETCTLVGLYGYHSLSAYLYCGWMCSCAFSFPPVFLSVKKDLSAFLLSAIALEPADAVSSTQIRARAMRQRLHAIQTIFSLSIVCSLCVGIFTALAISTTWFFQRLGYIVPGIMAIMAFVDAMLLLFHRNRMQVAALWHEQRDLERRPCTTIPIMPTTLHPALSSVRPRAQEDTFNRAPSVGSFSIQSVLNQIEAKTMKASHSCDSSMRFGSAHGGSVHDATSFNVCLHLQAHAAAASPHSMARASPHGTPRGGRRTFSPAPT